MRAAQGIGVLMLETRFSRIPGDIGCAEGLPFAVRHRVVKGALAQRVVQQHDGSLLPAFVQAGRDLVRSGVAAITTSCGFLVLYQAALQRALPVPVFTSSLLALPELQRSAPAGVLTVDAHALGAEHLRAAGAALDTPVEGLASGCAFQRTLLLGEGELDVSAACAETVSAARRLVARHPEVRSIVLECTNMPPYADAVREATGRPVHHIVTLLASRYANGAGLPP